MKTIRARLTSKGQVTLPKPLRVALSLGTGDNVQFSITPDGGVTLSKLPRPGVSAGCGVRFAIRNVPPSSRADIDRAVAEAMANRMNSNSPKTDGK
jgi:AbrB family looped-hinge helix DNA binding protein